MYVISNEKKDAMQKWFAKYFKIFRFFYNVIENMIVEPVNHIQTRKIKDESLYKV